MGWRGWVGKKDILANELSSPSQIFFNSAEAADTKAKGGSAREALAGLDLSLVEKHSVFPSWSDYEPDYKLGGMRLVRLQVFHLTQTFP